MNKINFSAEYLTRLDALLTHKYEMTKVDISQIPQDYILSIMLDIENKIKNFDEDELNADKLDDMVLDAEKKFVSYIQENNYVENTICISPKEELRSVNYKEEKARPLEKSIKGAVIPSAQIVHDAAVGLEAFSRAGYSKNLKGNVQEIMVKNKYNLSPKRIIDGNKAYLTKSATAIRDDIIIKNPQGNIVSRLQIKDVVSDSGIKDVVREVSKKHYTGTKLMGSPETKKLYESAVKKASEKGVIITQKMGSTGISSSTTSRIAQQTIGANACSLPKGTFGKLMSSSAVAGGAFSGGIELISSGIQMANGEIDGEEFTKNVVRETAGGALATATASTVASAATITTATACSIIGAPAIIPAIIGGGVAFGAGCLVKSIFDCIFA